MRLRCSNVLDAGAAEVITTEHRLHSHGRLEVEHTLPAFESEASAACMTRHELRQEASAGEGHVEVERRQEVTRAPGPRRLHDEVVHMRVAVNAHSVGVGAPGNLGLMQRS
eukprot:CAMPEP_0170569690 /NCGR_PEP_ID=MMETSP0224-20130122/697_1 /TAXON_ID=285029 /ORGANISM="Togula jolla, Strain CCCM 725" /LENGTH=110 /DNA_ID=CAMNT_0010891889 /DNA_START=84 /DNA_END=416 /DNA_ORIENTATION=+